MVVMRSELEKLLGTASSLGCAGVHVPSQWPGPAISCAGVFWKFKETNDFCEAVDPAH